MGITSSLVGPILIATLGAPRELIALVVAMEVGLIISLAITFFWKMSIHVASVAGAIVIPGLIFGIQFAVLAPIVALVGWARVELGVHSPGQVMVGAAIGSLVAALVLMLLASSVAAVIRLYNSGNRFRARDKVHMPRAPAHP